MVKIKTVMLALMLLQLLSCTKMKDPVVEETVERGFWLDAVAVTRLEYTGKNGYTANFILEVAGMKNGEITDIYPDSSFYAIPGFNGNQTFVPDSIERFARNDDKMFQTILLVDESCEDWLFVDDGSFIDAINRLKKLTMNSAGRFFGIGFFARDEYSGNSPVHFFRNSSSNSLFDHSHQEVMEFLSENYIHLGKAGSSSLYDAIDAALDELIADNRQVSRSVTVMAGNFDDGNSNMTAAQLIAKANNNNISINIILQGSVIHDDFYKMALYTGGFLSDCNGFTPVSNEGNGYNTARTVVFHIYELLCGNGRRYRIYGSVTKTNNWYSGHSAAGYLVAYHYREIAGGEFLSDDLDLNQRLPVYFKIP